MDYPLEDSQDPGSNKVILSAFKRSLAFNDREECGLFAWSDQYRLSFEFIPLKNNDSYDNKSFITSSSDYYDLYVNDRIISLFHSHIDDDPTPSPLDIEIAKSFCLPSLIFSNKNKNTYLFYPESYKPKKLENRIFIPYFQDCISFIKDFFFINLEINFSETIKDWSRPRNNPNEKLLKLISLHFNEVNLSDIKNNDVVIFFPTVDNLFHLGVFVENKFIYHHPFEGRPKKELFNQTLTNKVYKVYRHKDL